MVITPPPPPPKKKKKKHIGTGANLSYGGFGRGASIELLALCDCFQRDRGGGMGWRRGRVFIMMSGLGMGNNQMSAVRSCMFILSWI